MRRKAVGGELRDKEEWERLKMEKESEDKKLKKGFQERRWKGRRKGFGTFLPPLKSNIRTARGRISGWSSISLRLIVSF